jgi:hypothetical protein
MPNYKSQKTGKIGRLSQKKVSNWERYYDLREMPM